MKDLQEYWIEVNRLENEADSLPDAAGDQLFSGRRTTC